MANLDFGAHNALVRTFPEGLRHLSRVSLDSAERAAVMLARSDTASSVRAGHFGDRILGVLFGVRRPNRLADLRLEALRRFAVAVAHGKRHLIDWEKAELRALRFTDVQIGEAAALAEQFRRPVATRGPMYAVLWLLALCVALVSARQYLDALTIAVLMTGAVAVPLLAFAAPRAIWGFRALGN